MPATDDGLAGQIKRQISRVMLPKLTLILQLLTVHLVHLNSS